MSDLIERARRWVVEKYPYNSYHLLKSLEWVDALAPDASPAVRMATLTHDMERAFPGPDQPVAKHFLDEEYYVLHSARSARIVGDWLRSEGSEETYTQAVEALIRVHEVGGWHEANLVQAADSLSFLETNIDLFLNMARSGKRSTGEVREKFEYTLDRIQIPRASELARPLHQAAMARLAALETELSDARV